MKKNLQQFLHLNNSDFIKKIISLNQGDVSRVLYDNSELKVQYTQKVIDLYNQGIVNKDFDKDTEFAQSLALLELLEPDYRGWVFYFSFLRGCDFKAAYNAVNLGFNINPKMIEFIPRFSFDEISRLARHNRFEHLENGIDYLKFLENGLKPFLDTSVYVFILYASFVHHVKTGFDLNNKHFLNNVGLNSEDSHKKYKEDYFVNIIQLIEQYKKKLNFEDWTPDLISLFHKDIKTPNPYSDLSITNTDYTLQEFQPYGNILEKIILKEIFSDKFPAMGKVSKKTKI